MKCVTDSEFIIFIFLNEMVILFITELRKITFKYERNKVLVHAVLVLILCSTQTENFQLSLIVINYILFIGDNGGLLSNR